MILKKYTNPNPNGKYLIDCPGCGQRKEAHAKNFCYKCYKKFAWKGKEIKCKSCGRLRPHKAFGLCSGCHVRLYHYDLTKSYNAKKLYNLSLGKLKELTKTCQACGFDKVVSLHHLDGNKKNNNDKNLVGLCPNCHAMIHSYDYYQQIRDILKDKGYNTENVHPSNHANFRKILTFHS